MSRPGQPAIPASIRDAAGDWLERRQADHAPDVEREFRIWLAADPRHRKAYDAIARDWRDSAQLIARDVGRTRQLGRAPFLLRHSTHVGAAGVGLAIVFGLVTVGVVRQTGPFALVSPAEAATYRTGLGEIRTVKLEDGSEITLDTETLVQSSLTPDARRLELVHGRARFRVAGDRRPFTVAIPGGNVSAKTTLFDVSAIERPTRVIALEGNVELRLSTSAGPASRQMLAPGEQLVLGNDARPQRADPAARRWVSGMLTLTATPLGEAVAAINRYNRVQVQLADASLATRAMSGAFRVHEPLVLAHAMAATFELTIDQSDPDVIRITARDRTAAQPP